MGDFDIQDYGRTINYGEIGQVSDTQAPSGGQPDSGASSIEKSKTVGGLYIPLASYPILEMPSSSGDMALSNIVAVAKNGSLELFLLEAHNQIHEITNEILDGWSENIRKISEETREIINSPQYQQLLAIRLHGNDNITVSLDQHARALEKISEADQSKSADAEDAAKVAIIPFMTIAATALGVASVSGEISITPDGMSSAPISGSVEIVNRLEPLLPTLMQDIIPSINLLVMPLIYFTSWDASIGSMTQKERVNNQEAAKSFAKEVISMVSNPAFSQISFIEEMFKSTTHSENFKAQRIAVMKLCLACVALSLLYSIDVGKVMGNKFWGMEPQEFQGLLSGEIPIDDPFKVTKKLTESEQMKLTLIRLIKAQLDFLPAEERLRALEGIFDYFYSPHDLKSMLDPAKVLHDVFKSAYDPETKASLVGEQPV